MQIFFKILYSSIAFNTILLASVGCIGLPYEVAKVVAFLLSEDASYVNGQTIAIDGGESNVYGNV